MYRPNAYLSIPRFHILCSFNNSSTHQRLHPALHHHQPWWCRHMCTPYEPKTEPFGNITHNLFGVCARVCVFIFWGVGGFCVREVQGEQLDGPNAPPPPPPEARRLCTRGLLNDRSATTEDTCHVANLDVSQVTVQVTVLCDECRNTTNLKK